MTNKTTKIGLIYKLRRLGGVVETCPMIEWIVGDEAAGRVYISNMTDAPINYYLFFRIREIWTSAIESVLNRILLRLYYVFSQNPG
jgi:hypothetical protein